MDEEGEWVENDEALRKSVNKDRTLCRMLLKKKVMKGVLHLQNSQGWSVRVPTENRGTT